MGPFIHADQSQLSLFGELGHASGGRETPPVVFDVDPDQPRKEPEPDGDRGRLGVMLHVVDGRLSDAEDGELGLDG